MAKRRSATTIENIEHNICEAEMDIHKLFEVSFNIVPEEQTWKSNFRDISTDKIIGSIEGNISIEKGSKTFAISTTEDLDDAYRGKGLGKLLYELTIKKVLDIFPDAVFRSSSSLNNNSTGVWKSLEKQYSNVVEAGDHYEVRRGMII
jgi:hypothetical protein